MNDLEKADIMIEERLTGGVCKCPESKKPITERKWFVLDRECNHSAFNGYARTPSAYSCVHCNECIACWRTKAAYVGKLKDETTS